MSLRKDTVDRQADFQGDMALGMRLRFTYFGMEREVCGPCFCFFEWVMSVNRIFFRKFA